MKPGRRGLVALLLAVVVPALAHHAPPSYVRFDFQDRIVRALVMLPVSELAYAMDGAPSAQSLPAYLLEHTAARALNGEAWTLRIANVRATSYLDQPFLVATLTMTPPANASAREFVFLHDAITHEVRNHHVMLVAERDYRGDAGPALLGALQHPMRELHIRR